MARPIVNAALSEASFTVWFAPDLFEDGGFGRIKSN